MSKKSTLDGYKSPLKKLVKFFLQSRDKWKARANDKQKRIDFLETKVKDLINSRNHWKQKAKTRENASHSGNVSNPALNQSQELLKAENTDINEIVDKYYSLDDIEVLPHANGSASLVPSGRVWPRYNV